jgi:hypothetical protein
MVELRELMAPFIFFNILFREEDNKHLFNLCVVRNLRNYNTLF